MIALKIFKIIQPLLYVQVYFRNLYLLLLTYIPKSISFCPFLYVCVSKICKFYFKNNKEIFEFKFLFCVEYLFLKHIDWYVCLFYLHISGIFQQSFYEFDRPTDKMKQKKGNHILISKIFWNNLQ